VRSFIRRYGKYIFTLFLIMAVASALLYLIDRQVKRKMIEDHNAIQLVYAQQAAIGIEAFFNDHTEMLLTMVKNEHIVDLDEAGRRMMSEIQLSLKGREVIISRIDRRGRILHSEPYDGRVIGQPVTRIDDFREVERTRRVVVSDVFTNRRGFKSIMVHVPVFRRGSFDGTLAMIFPFNSVAKRFIEAIRVGKDGYAWLISKMGIEIFCPVPGHVGNSVFDNCRDFPDIIAMAKRMTRGEQGAATYHFDRIRGEVVDKTTKHAVFMPIRLGNTFWSIVVATPEDELLRSLESFRIRITLIAILFMISLGFFFYVLLRTQILTEEIERRQKLEANLRESEERYRNLFENAHEAILVVQDGKVVFLNPMAVMRAGYSCEELMARPFIEFIHPDDRDMVIDRNLRRMKDEEILLLYPFRILHRDGDIRWVELKSVLINWQGKAATMNFLADITDRKRAEEDSRRLEDRLNRAEKMEALGTMAGGVAHDLNNILGVVVGYAEMLLRREDEASPIRPKLMNILKGGERAAAVVQDLLTLARRGVPSRQVLNLNDIVTDVRQSPEFMNFSTYHPLMRLKFDLDPELLNINGSPVHLGKTLYNLAANAGEATPKGGVLTIKTTNQYLDKPIHGYDEVREGDYVVLSVSDTGEGIPAADLKRIFEPFYTKKVMGRSGTGLGLAVVWGTVKDHDGYINVQSEEGKGSIFTLYFPVTREEMSAEELAVAISDYMGKGESVLVADDVRGQRDLATEMLRELNYRVESVGSGEEAVAYLQEHNVDLMVLDMIMDPGMDGLDTYRSVIDIRPQQKAIIVSGFSETDRVYAAQNLGAGAYVRKPYVIEKLGLAVRKELDRPA